MKPVRVLTLCVWMGSIGVSLFFFEQYERTPGAKFDAPLERPPESSLDFSHDKFTLIMFVHPHCPCVSASVTELETIATRYEEKLSARVVFVRPPGVPTEWEKGSLWTQVGKCAHLTSTIDEDGVEAGRFGARTSGHAYLLSPEGRIVFEGGLTESRGGCASKQSSIGMWIEHDRDAPSSTPVYGCPLD